MKITKVLPPPPPPPPKPEPTYHLELSRSELATLFCALHETTQRQRERAATHMGCGAILSLGEKERLYVDMLGTLNS